MASLSPDVVALLRCPITAQPLKRADLEDLEKFAPDFPEGGFITEDGQRIYPIRDGLVHLVASEAVERS